MTNHDTADQGLRRGDDDEHEPRTLWGHSLAAAAVCIGTGVAVALVAIFGQPG